MAAKIYTARPEVGALVAFNPNASKRLAGIPGKVERIVARMQNGDYLVTLEYAQPVKVGDTQITRVDAFASHLDRIAAHASY